MISPESSAHGLVVHVRLVLMKSPQPGDRLAVHQLEDSLLSVAPLDKLGTAVLVLKGFICRETLHFTLIRPVEA